MKGSTAQAANDSVRAELRTVVDNRPTGELLKAARLARDDDLQTVAQHLRIRRPYLEAIETGDIRNLPGPTYAIGFVRAYAEYLDLDADRIVAAFKAEAQTHEEQTQLVFPEPMPGSWVPSGAVILVALLLIAGAYGGWMYLSSEDRSLASLTPPVPESLRSLVMDAPAPGETTAEEPALPAAQPVDSPVVDSLAVDAAAAPAEESPAADRAATAGIDAIEAPAGVTDESVAAAAAEGVVAPVEPAEEPAAPTPAPIQAPIQAPVQGGASDALASETEPVGAAGIDEVAREAPPEAATAATASDAGGQASGTLVRPPAPPAGERTAALGEGAAAIGDQRPEVTAAPAVGDVPATTLDATTPDIPPASGDGAAVYGVQNEASRILIRARQPSWVEITGADGEVLLTRLLRKGDVYVVPDRPGIRLVTGNAGGLEFEVDGATAPDIGPIGSVRRNVLLEPQALSSGQASAAGDG